MPRFSGFLLFLFFLFLSACSGHHQQEEGTDTGIPIDDTLRQSLQTFITKRQPAERLALYVYDLTADTPIFSYRADSLMPPASCLKLLTAVTFLKRFGANYHYSTELYTHGTIRHDTLFGNVAFKGSSDPLLQIHDLPVFFHQLKKKNIHHIQGKLYVNLAHEEPPTPEEHWYAWDTHLSQYGILYQEPQKILRAIRQSVHSQGISVNDDDVCLGTIPNGSHRIFRLRRSATFPLMHALKNSSNTLSTSLLYTLGTTIKDTTSIQLRGISCLREFIQEELNDSEDYIIHDGCGLCRFNRLTPTLLVRILQYGYNDPDIYQSLKTYLPSSGVDGTLLRQLPKANMRNKIHAKTGTISNPYGISCLAGYCKGQDGHQLAFAIMNQDMSVLDARPFQERICEIMLNSKKFAR